MNETQDWLPELELFSSYAGAWEIYLDSLYNAFKQDFIDSKPIYNGIRLGLKRYPISEGKEATFWHLISEGSKESERIPDLRRCERIRWPKPVIENGSKPDIKIWSENRSGSNRIHLWLESEGYLVVLDQRKDYILPWTAFYVERSHQKAKYTKRWKRHTGS